MLDFYICLLKSKRCPDKDSKKKSISIFLSHVLTCKSRVILVPEGYKAGAKNRRLGIIVTSFQGILFRGK